MQNLNQTESPINYPPTNLNQQSYENAVSFGSDLNTTDESLAIDSSTSFQSDSMSNFFSGPTTEFNIQTNFMFNDKFPSNPNYVNPYVVDEISQTSQTSTCSSQFDGDSSRQQSTIKMNSTQKQQQLTNQFKIIPEEESTQSSIQSPASYPSQQQQTNKPTVFASPTGTSKAKKNESISKLYEMTNEPERKIFIDRLIAFNESNGNTMTVCPRIAKNLIDLFKVYNLVKERGGFLEACKKLCWKEIATICGFPITTTTAYSLRKQYIKHLLNYECKFDLNGVNPEVLIEQSQENVKNKKKKPTSQNSSPTINQPQQPSTQPIPSQQLAYKHSSPNQMASNLLPPLSTPNQIVKQPIYNNQQMIYNHNYESSSHLQPPSKTEQQQQQQQQMINYEQQSQSFMNQMPNNQMLNYEPHAYSTSNQQDYNKNNNMNQLNYSAYGESDGQLNYQSSNQLEVAKPSTTHQHYYSDSNQQYNATQFNQYNDHHQIQYSNFNTTNYQQQPDIITYANPDSSRVSATHSNRIISATNEQQYSSAKSSYQFTNNYDYTVALQQQQLNRTQNATSQQTSTNYNPYQNVRVQQPPPPFVIENSNGLDTKQQYNQIENYQMNNWIHSNSNNNCYSPQPNHTQQQFSIESPNVQLIHKTSQHPSFNSTGNLTQKAAQQPLIVQQHLPQTNYYPGMTNNLSPKYLSQQHLNHHHLMQVSHYSNASNSALFNQPQQNSQLSQLQQLNQPSIRTSFKLDYAEFPPNCIESVKPKNPITKRKLTAKDLPNNDYSKLIMSLKSGLLAESTQALNAFSITSSDESTCHQLKLHKYPKLLPKLMHYFEFFVGELFPNLFPSCLDNDESKIENNVIEHERSDQVIESNSEHLEKSNLENDYSTEQNSTFEEVKHVNNTNDHSFILTSMHLNKKMKKEEDTSIEPNIMDNLMLRINYFDYFENEVKMIETDTLCTLDNYKEDAKQRCISISTIIRNLSLIAGNEHELSNDKKLLSIIGKLLCFKHEHYEKKIKKEPFSDQNYANNHNLNNNDQDYSKQENKETWWVEALNIIQENLFVTLAQMSACLDFDVFGEELLKPVLSGLIHFALCPSATAEDNFRYTSIKSCSPKRLALECLAKLSILDGNVHLITMTPPRERMLQLYKCLSEYLSRDQEQILRELALVLLHNFVVSDDGVAREISVSTNIISELFNYLIQYEENMPSSNQTDNQHHQNELKLNLDMAKRAAYCLKKLASIKENHSLFSKQEEKLTRLSCSENLDLELSRQISEIFYELQSQLLTPQHQIIEQKKFSNNL